MINWSSNISIQRLVHRFPRCDKMSYTTSFKLITSYWNCTYDEVLPIFCQIKSSKDLHHTFLITSWRLVINRRTILAHSSNKQWYFLRIWYKQNVRVHCMYLSIQSTSGVFWMSNNPQGFNIFLSDYNSGRYQILFKLRIFNQT